MKTEFKLYITNPQYFNNTQNDFEKNLSGSIVVEETVAPSGMTEKTATAKVTGIPVPFRNPQSNVEIPDNDGTITVIGEPTMFLEPKVLATELIAVIIDRFATKYGVNIDFSLNAPETPAPAATTPPAITPETTTTGPKVGIGVGLGVGLAIGGGLLAAGVAGTLIGKDGKTASSTEDATTQPPITAAPAAGGTSGTLPGTSGADAAGTLPANPGAITAPAISATPSTSGADAVGTLPAGTLDNPVTPPTIPGTSGSATKTATDPIDTLQPKKLAAIPVLVPSQYIDCYQIAKVSGAPALVTTPETKQMVLTDPEFDRPEFLPNNMTKPLKINIDGTGDFKINIEGGNPGGKKVGNWSEGGTQLIPTQDEQKEFFDMCEKHKELYGNKFSYTLATRPDWDEAQKAVQTNNALPAEPEKIDTLPAKAATGVDNKTTPDGISAPPPPIEKKVEEEVPVEEPKKEEINTEEAKKEPKKDEQPKKDYKKTMAPTINLININSRFGGAEKTGTKQIFSDEFLDSKRDKLLEELDKLAEALIANPGWTTIVTGLKFDRASLRTAADTSLFPQEQQWAKTIIGDPLKEGKRLEEELTKKKAQRVKDYLVSKGVPEGQITVSGSGERPTGSAKNINVQLRYENGQII